MRQESTARVNSASAALELGQVGALAALAGGGLDGLGDEGEEVDLGEQPEGGTPQARQFFDRIDSGSAYSPTCSVAP